jgi:hypothetical protein
MRVRIFQQTNRCVACMTTCIVICAADNEFVANQYLHLALASYVNILWAKCGFFEMIRQYKTLAKRNIKTIYWKPALSFKRYDSATSRAIAARFTSTHRLLFIFLSCAFDEGILPFESVSVLKTVSSLQPKRAYAFTMRGRTTNECVAVT